MVLGLRVIGRRLYRLFVITYVASGRGGVSLALIWLLKVLAFFLTCLARFGIGRPFSGTVILPALLVSGPVITLGGIDRLDLSQVALVIGHVCVVHLTILVVVALLPVLALV